MILQLAELIPMRTPLGDGYAILYEAGEHDAYWTVAMENGALVTFPQEKVRLSRSYTHGRGISDAQMRKIIGRKECETPQVIEGPAKRQRAQPVLISPPPTRLAKKRPRAKSSGVGRRGAAQPR